MYMAWKLSKKLLLGIWMVISSERKSAKIRNKDTTTAQFEVDPSNCTDNPGYTDPSKEIPIPLFERSHHSKTRLLHSSSFWRPYILLSFMLVWLSRFVL